MFGHKFALWHSLDRSDAQASAGRAMPQLDDRCGSCSATSYRPGEVERVDLSPLCIASDLLMNLGRQPTNWKAGQSTGIRHLARDALFRAPGLPRASLWSVCTAKFLAI